MQLRFLGAAGTVTGSKTLLSAAGRQVLIDCGAFQGVKNLRARNWAAPAFDVERLDAVVLTHAHIDHSGYLPVLARYGYKGPVYCTSATRDLCEILLLDSARLEEEQAAFVNRHGKSKHQPALPLFTAEDAHRAIALLKPLPFIRRFKCPPRSRCTSGMPATFWARRWRSSMSVPGSCCFQAIWDGRTIRSCCPRQSPSHRISWCWSRRMGIGCTTGPIPARNWRKS